jgi:hypothetical protein
MLLGNWKVNKWTEISSGKKITNQMDFSFEEDGRYLLDYGKKKEHGKYWIANEYLHTIEEGKAEKKVKIISLQKDTLAMEMNRAGSIEKVILVRK